MTDTTLRTVIRRETHSPRTTAMLTVVTLAVLALVYAGIEIVLFTIGAQPLLVSPPAVFDALADPAGSFASAAVIAAGAVVALIGVVLIVLALKPGRLSRHEMTYRDRAVVVDNGVIASALAQHLSNESGIARDNILVGVSHRTVDVTVRPPLGIPVDADRVQRIIEGEVETYALTPRVRTQVRVQRPADDDRSAAASPRPIDREAVR